MYTLVCPPDSPCGCGSGREFGKCCLKDGNIRTKPKLLDPPKPTTGHTHPKCALNWTNDCDPKISGDHFVSKSVLKVLGGGRIKITTRDFSREHSLDSSSLKTKKLCRRHNSALSPIDAEAARFFSAFVSIHGALEGLNASQKFYFFSGIDIDRWMIKTLLMVYYAKLSNITPDTHNLPVHAKKMFTWDLGSPYGIYFRTKMDSGDEGRFRVEGATTVQIHTAGKTVVGVTISLGGFPMTLIFHGNPRKFGISKESHAYRPKNLVFFKGDDVYCIAMAYPKWKGEDIWISNGDSNAPIPSNESAEQADADKPDPASSD
ncbi:MAG: hypothetical protein P1U86_18660 [Verrucomicrobiales bacterium]|nr:hypothetical protein [Verrucomicrobiales bacterium]